MPRARRLIPPDSIVHLVNRGNERHRIFDDDFDYGGFLTLVDETRRREEVRVLGYCLMPNHWHLVVWPTIGQAVSRMCHRVCSIHALRRRKRTGTLGDGHVYQRRYHAVHIRSERQYYTVLRYVEANALRAGLVSRAEQWPWSSLAERSGSGRGLVESGPLPLPEDWRELVNESLPQEVLDEARASLRRCPSRPVG